MARLNYIGTVGELGARYPEIYDLLGRSAPRRFGQALPMTGGNTASLIQGNPVGVSVGGLSERFKKGLTIQHELSPATVQQLKTLQAEQKALVVKVGVAAVGLSLLAGIAYLLMRARDGK